jgi:large subunit ribosomal protein L10
MPNAQNVETLAKIKEELENVSAMWVVDYRGLTVKEAEQLRRDIREAGAHLTVYKNTLMQIALAEQEMPAIDDMLKGPSAFVFADGDPAAAAKAIKEFAKGNENLVIKGGIMDGKVIDAQTVQAIADLPSREELLGRMVGSMKSPISKLAIALQAVADQKGEGTAAQEG